ncbi:hypothetical protein V2I01_22585 [Micromonospora sp. BRA006-A]|nr:hypothetical protein [Micromonospora sp. BRA006-A]
MAFFRSLGGAIGVGALGAILGHRVSGYPADGLSRLGVPASGSGGGGLPDVHTLPGRAAPWSSPRTATPPVTSPRRRPVRATRPDRGGPHPEVPLRRSNAEPVPHRTGDGRGRHRRNEGLTVDAAERERYGPQTRPLPYERGTDGRGWCSSAWTAATSMRAAAYAAGLARRQGATLCGGVRQLAHLVQRDALRRGGRCGPADPRRAGRRAARRCRRGPRTGPAGDVPAGAATPTPSCAGPPTSTGPTWWWSLVRAGRAQAGRLGRPRLVRTGRWPVVVVP